VRTGGEKRGCRSWGKGCTGEVEYVFRSLKEKEGPTGTGVGLWVWGVMGWV